MTNKYDYEPDKPVKEDSLASLIVSLPTVATVAFGVFAYGFIYFADPAGARAFFCISFLAALVTIVMSFFVFFRTKTKKVKTFICFMIAAFFATVIFNFFPDYIAVLAFWELY